MCLCVRVHSFIAVNIYYANLVTHWLKEFNAMRLFYIPCYLTQWIPLAPFTSEETETQRGYTTGLRILSWWVLIQPQSLPSSPPR